MTKRIRINVVLLALFMALGACSVVWSQAAGSLVGTVADKSGAIIPDAKVTLTNLATNVTQTVQSNSAGNFQILQLIPGNYQVTVEKTGFAKFVVKSFQIETGIATREDATLQVGAESQTVEVTTEAP